MKAAFILAIPYALTAQEAPLPAPKQEAIAALPTTKSAILIDAKARSEDILKVYDLMKKEKPTYRITARTISGQTLSNIVDITAMPNGTLLLFKLSGNQGLKYQIISVEDFLDFFYS